MGICHGGAGASEVGSAPKKEMGARERRRGGESQIRPQVERGSVWLIGAALHPEGCGREGYQCGDLCYWFHRL